MSEPFIREDGTLAERMRSAGFAAVAEALMASEKWPAFNSAHEGFAVLKEEVDELWDQVRINQKKRDVGEMKKEAIQVAAMALRFVIDICNEEGIRK